MEVNARKKLNIKNFKRPKLPDNNYMSEAWMLLEKAVIALQMSRPVETSLEVLYSSVANLCQPQFVKQVYENLARLIDNHTRNSIDQIKDSSQFLKDMNSCWQNHCQQLIMIRSIFLFLDRTHVLTNPSIMSIWDLGLERFRHYFSTISRVQKRTTDDILSLIQEERDGNIVDRNLIKDLLSMLSTLSIYLMAFEQRFIQETERLYRTKSDTLVNEYDVPQYLKYVEKIIMEETDRSSIYLDSNTKRPLIETVEQELIAKHLKLILSKGIDNLLENMRIDDLVLLHALLSRVENGPHEICQHFNQFVKKQGKLLVANPEKDKSMVSELLTFKEQMDKVVNDCFMSQERFINSLKEAFEHFINQRPNKPAELIAKYIDARLRSGNKEATEEELEKMLDRILVLFRFIHGKDVFEAFYKKDLAKRLLVNKSASVDAEKSMLTKLKQECGAAFTGKLEGMFKDIEVSKDIMLNFRTYLANAKIAPSLDIYVNVLTMGFWPTYQPIKITIPQFMLKHQDFFEKFYTQKHSGRKLQWQPNLDQCTLVADYRASQGDNSNDDRRSRHELQVSLFQAIVLLLFNSKDELTYKEILEATSIESLELKRTLQSLACGKTRVIIKDPKGKDVTEDDKFLYNSKFQYHLFKVKINQVQLKETQEEQAMTQEKVFQDRQYQIDAAIVRVMKTRKKLSHQLLLNEVFDLLRFSVRAQDMKARIESLIERDFLKREPDNVNIYNYVA